VPYRQKQGGLSPPLLALLQSKALVTLAKASTVGVQVKVRVVQGLSTIVTV
jgi:hypothetical protein